MSGQISGLKRYFPDRLNDVLIFLRYPPIQAPLYCGQDVFCTSGGSCIADHGFKVARLVLDSAVIIQYKDLLWVNERSTQKSLSMI